MTTSAETHPGPSRLTAFLFNVILPLSFLMLIACIGGWISERQGIRREQEQRQEVAAGVALTARGCPAARPKIREIGRDGTYSRREIEVLDALVTAEQARPDGLDTCRAPSWRWSWGEWAVSTGYAQ